MPEVISHREQLLGENIGGCLVEAAMGGGSMGWVFRAKHLSLDKTVALKVLDPNLSKSNEVRERFMREARVASAIEHPGVIPIYGVGETDSFAYIIMRFLDGASLYRVLSRQGMDQLLTARIGEQVASALAAVHRAGFVHRDVKPENILITQRGEAFLTDFGVASKQGEAKPAGRAGSPPYMSPEQCKGEAIYGRSDIYSLGVTLYQMLAGRRPFLGVTTASLMLQHQQDDPPRLELIRPEVHPSFAGLIRRMLAKDPSDRPEDSDQVAQELADLQEDLRTLRRRASTLIQRRDGLRSSDSTVAPVPAVSEDEGEVERQVEQMEVGLLAMPGVDPFAGDAPDGQITVSASVAGERAARGASDAIAKAQFDRAVELVNRALKFRPNDPRLLVLRGHAERRRGNNEAAEADYRLALRHAPADVRALCALGGLLRNQGLTGEAEKLLLKAVELNPSSVEARITLGRMYEKVGSQGAARKQYEAAIEANQHDERPAVALAALLVSQGKPGAAKALLGAARERNPGSASALFWLAAISAEEGRSDFAVGLLEDSIKAGLRDVSLIASTPHFQALNGNPRFQGLLGLLTQGTQKQLFDPDNDLELDAEPVL